MEATPTPPLSPEQADMATDLAAKLVERLRLQGMGKAAPPLPSLPAQSEAQKTEAAANDWPVAAETKAQDRGPTAAIAERENTSPPPSPQAEALSKEMTSRTINGATEGKEEGKRVDLRLARSGLSPEVKRRLVELFATFHTVSNVVAMIEKEFGLILDARQAIVFNADHYACRMGKTLRAYFDKVREHHIGHVSKVAISHQAQRLRLLSGIVEKAEKSKDFNAALKGLELAAKEMGGMMDASVARKVEHSGAVAHVHGTVEDARAEVAMRLRSMVEALPPPDPAPQAIQDAEFSAVSDEDAPPPA
jgi:hypothetical protein